MANQMSVTIPQTVYERAKQLADSRHQAVAELFADALELIEAASSSDQAKLMAQEEEAYRNMHHRLMISYSGEYVAIYRGELVDHDPDELTLLHRLDKNYPHDVVLMRKVLPIPEPELRFRSPRLVGEL